jgi:hypothetical protein
VRSLAIGPDDTVLVHAARARSVRPWSSSRASSARPCSARRATVAPSGSRLGATPLPYGPGVVDRVRELAPQGVTVAIDLVGTDEALEQSIALVADKARIATLVRGADAAGLGIRAFSGGSPDPLTARSAWRARRSGTRRSSRPGRSRSRSPRGAARRRRRGHRLVDKGTDGKVVLRSPAAAPPELRIRRRRTRRRCAAVGHDPLQLGRRGGAGRSAGRDEAR